MTKIDLVQSYIEQCESTNNNEKLENEIVSVFGLDIPNIQYGLDHGRTENNPDAFGFPNYNFIPGNHVHNVELLKRKLMKFKVDLEEENKKETREHEKLRLQAEISKSNIQVTATGGTANATATSTATITIDQTIKAINKMPQGIMNDEEKEKLQEDLYTLEGIKATKDKNKFWNKAKPVLAFLADKGADAMITAAPYIITALQTI